jgi:hypothetical protein
MTHLSHLQDSRGFSIVIGALVMAVALGLLFMILFAAVSVLTSLIANLLYLLTAHKLFQSYSALTHSSMKYALSGAIYGGAFGAITGAVHGAASAVRHRKQHGLTR